MNTSTICTRPRHAAWLLVLVYLFCIPGVAPAATASLALLVGEHEVMFTLDSGHLDVVLHHNEEHHSHVHGVLTKLITGIAVHNDDDDHVLHFSNGSDAINNSSTALNAPATKTVCMPWHGASFHHASSISEAMQRHAARPPPRTSIEMLCLRTTVLRV